MATAWHKKAVRVFSFVHTICARPSEYMVAGTVCGMYIGCVWHAY